jgi:hypothetical protein
VFLNALDGFDLLAISFATPGIMKEFGHQGVDGLGVVLAADLLGMAVGIVRARVASPIYMGDVAPS